MIFTTNYNKCSYLLLFFFFALSLNFLAASSSSSSHCYEEEEEDNVQLLKLQKCQAKCFQQLTATEYNTTRQKICEMRCHDRFAHQSDSGGSLLSLLARKLNINSKKCKKNAGEKINNNNERKLGLKNPYYMEAEKFFYTRLRTKEGHFRILQRFSDNSKLLEGIDGFRLGVYEANPYTILLPHHRDADAIFLVTHGKAIINFVFRRWRQTFELERGDAINVHAGTTMYLINSDNLEKLKILVLLRPINSPARFKDFFGSGGENPRSFYRAFSKQVLRTALNIEEGKYKDFFERHDQGSIVKLNLEQVRALISGPDEGAFSPGPVPGAQPGEEKLDVGSKGPFSVLQQLKFSNELGQYFAATPDNTEQLKLKNIAVAFLNIKQGAMMLPHLHTRTTAVLMVIGGAGEFEIASPGVVTRERSQEEEEEYSMGNKNSSVQYEKISANLSVGDVIIIPSGHPISLIASENETLQLAGFGISAKFNYMQFLAGNHSIWNLIPPEVLAISFNSNVSEVKEVFGSQQQSFFVPLHKQFRRKTETEGEKGRSMDSIFNAGGFI